MSKYVFGLVCVLASMLPVTVGAAGSDVEAVDPWIRAAPPGVRSLAGYLTIKNHGPTDVDLVAATSPAFGNVMIHETSIVDGMARMEHRSMVTIVAGGEAQFTPGGLHLMLMQPKEPTQTGEALPITLRFSDGSELPVLFPVMSEAPASGPH